MENVELRSRMARQAMRFAAAKGYSPTPVPMVKVLYSDEYYPRQPVMYEPGIVIITGIITIDLRDTIGSNTNRCVLITGYSFSFDPPIREDSCEESDLATFSIRVVIMGVRDHIIHKRNSEE